MTIFDTPVPVGTGRVALDVTESLADHRARRPGPLEVQDLLQRAADAELRGYGGAFFPVARKWQAAIDAGGRGIVVANGAESEPASGKDAALLQLRPHLVLDGLKATVRATGSTEAVLWLHKGAQHSRVSIERAMVERRAAGVTDVPLRIVEGPARYLSGESTAIVRALSGGPALPHTMPVPAAISGVDGRPTLVHNVETLARVGLLATGFDPTQSRLLTVTTPSGRMVVDADPDETLSSIVERLGGGDTSAVLLGGYGGTWHRWEDVADAAGASAGDADQRRDRDGAPAFQLWDCGQRADRPASRRFQRPPVWTMLVRPRITRRGHATGRLRVRAAQRPTPDRTHLCRGGRTRCLPPP